MIYSWSVKKHRKQPGLETDIRSGREGGSLVRLSPKPLGSLLTPGRKCLNWIKLKDTQLFSTKIAELLGMKKQQPTHLVSAVFWWVLRVEWWVEKRGQRDFSFHWVSEPNDRPSTLSRETIGREGVFCQNRDNWETGRHKTLSTEIHTEDKHRNSRVMVKGNLGHHVLQAWKAAFADWKPTAEGSTRQHFKKKKEMKLVGCPVSSALCIL